MKAQKFIPMVVVAAGLLAYYNSFTGAFVLDDLGSIPENPTIRRLWPIWQCLSPPHRGGLTVEGRPFINLSLAINYALGGYNVWGYHALNLTVHILAGLTLFGIVRRTLLQPVLRERFGAVANELALATAVLWTVHPLQTESVTYIIQRAESIMGLFYLLTLYCFIRGVDSTVGTREGWPRRSAALPRSDAEVGMRSTASMAVGRDAVPRVHVAEVVDTTERVATKGMARTTLWFALSVVACALGMASKEVMVTAPLMVMLYDRAFLSNSFREAWRRRRPLYLGLAATWIVLGWVLILTVRNALTNAQHFGLTWWQYLAARPGVILYYLRLSVWPSPLCLNRPWPIVKTWTSILPAAVVVVMLLGATVWAWKRNPARLRAGRVWGFVGAWFFLILAPSSSFIPLQGSLYEHRMYLSLAAVVSLVVMGFYSLVGRRGLAVLVVAGIGLGFLTWQRNQDYRNEDAIFVDALTKFPDSAVAHYNLGVSFARAGRIQEAMGHWEQSLRLKPDYAEAYYNLGLALAQMGRVKEAVGYYEQALRLKPDYAEAHNKLGVALVRLSSLREAVGHYEQALRLKPDYAEAHYNLGLALAQLGKVQEAMGHWEQSLRIEPDNAEAHYNLGLALWRAGKPQDAIGHWEQALQIKPDYAKAHYYLGVVLEQAGRVPEAIGHLEQALRIKPDYAEAQERLGALRAGPVRRRAIQ